MLRNVGYNFIACATPTRPRFVRPAACNMATSATVTLPTGRSLQIPTGLFIDNKFVPAIKGGTFECAAKGLLHALRLTLRTTEPSIRQLNKSSVLWQKVWYTALRTASFSNDVLLATAEDIDLAVRSSRGAFKSTWGNNVTGTERGRLIHKLADLMDRDHQVLAELEALDNGKPVRIAQ